MVIDREILVREFIAQLGDAGKTALKTSGSLQAAEATNYIALVACLLGHCGGLDLLCETVRTLARDANVSTAGSFNQISDRLKTLADADMGSDN